ncbi:unnamed protein product, partial [Medioppia subpectinata]
MVSFAVQFTLVFAMLSIIAYYCTSMRNILTICDNILLILFTTYLFTILWRKFKPKIMLSSMGKAVLITGCDTGFGHRLAVRLNQRGFRVYATVISESSDGAIGLTSKVPYPDKMHVLAMDVTSEEQVQKAVEHVKLHLNEKSQGDQLWAIVNNAGTACIGPMEWGSVESYERVFAVNMFGVVRVTRAFLPLIRASRGRVVNVASMLGRFSVCYIGWYCMSKHAVIAFSDTLRREMRSFGVRVATIEPSFFRTGITQQDNSLRGLLRTWSQTPTDIQQAYGNNYLDGLKENILQNDDVWRSGDNINIVVNDIIDGIQNAEPKVRYTPVQGCDSGFGHRLAVRLNERGFRVYATVVSESSAGAIELTTNARFSDKMHILAMDVTRDNHVQRAYKYIKLHLKEKCHGDYLWALVNNAGICNECPIEWGTEEMYEQVFAVNMFGVIRVTRAFLPLIRASQGRVSPRPAYFPKTAMTACLDIQYHPMGLMDMRPIIHDTFTTRP